MADVVVVDDDEDVAWVLQQLLEIAGHNVRVAHDGEEGLLLLQERLPDVAILDVEMPLLDGPSMSYRMFVHNCGLENIPIVLVSGVFDLSRVAARVGTPYFCAKPFDTSAMMSLVDRALTERALPRPTP
ncbi:MAG: response regulator [Myxococcales bacterium]|nr:response regulator [Myxococcales bacterium]